jgi:hypothetical protein
MHWSEFPPLFPLLHPRGIHARPPAQYPADAGPAQARPLEVGESGALGLQLAGGLGGVTRTPVLALTLMAVAPQFPLPLRPDCVAPVHAPASPAFTPAE